MCVCQDFTCLFIIEQFCVYVNRHFALGSLRPGVCCVSETQTVHEINITPSRNNLPCESACRKKRQRSRLDVMKVPVVCWPGEGLAQLLQLINTPSGIFTHCSELYTRIYWLFPRFLHYIGKSKNTYQSIGSLPADRSLAFGVCVCVCGRECASVCLGFRCHFIADILFALNSKKANISCRILISKS